MEFIWSILLIGGFIFLVRYINRKAEEGGNWLSNKPSVDEITRQQLAKEDELT
jgi:hypothetical protein